MPFERLSQSLQQEIAVIDGRIGIETSIHRMVPKTPPWASLDDSMIHASCAVNRYRQPQ